MTRKPRVAFVVQRCGADIAGGAEALALGSARIMRDDWECEILTTCARDARTWANALPPGATRIDGVAAHRFPVPEPREPRTFDALSERFATTPGSLEEQEAWMRAQGPYSPGLLEHLVNSGRTYDCVFFFSYLYATTYFGLPLVGDRAVLVPLAHDEWMLRLPLFERLFKRAPQLGFVSEEERLLVETRFAPRAPSTLLRPAIEAARGNAASFRDDYGIGDPFALYVGRVEPAKGVGELVAHFAALQRVETATRHLVLLGPIAMDLPPRADILALGRVSESDKWNALEACDYVVVPSAFESLSLVALEAWAAGKPVLANGASAVLVGQCRRANAGLWYANEREFVELARSRFFGYAPTLGRNGKRYVARTFTRATARESLLAAFAARQAAA